MHGTKFGICILTSPIDDGLCFDFDMIHVMFMIWCRDKDGCTQCGQHMMICERCHVRGASNPLMMQTCKITPQDMVGIIYVMLKKAYIQQGSVSNM